MAWPFSFWQSAAIQKPEGRFWAGSDGWPVLKAAVDQEYSVIRQFAASN